MDIKDISQEQAQAESAELILQIRIQTPGQIHQNGGHITAVNYLKE